MTGRPVRLLIVEDATALRRSLRGYLEDEGVHVLGEAGDGAEGVAMARSLRPDVVLMDLRMPRMGGLEAGRLIKGALPHTEIVLLTAYDDPILKDGAERMGVHAYLVKGCSAGQILDAIREARDRVRTERGGFAEVQGTTRAGSPSRPGW